MESTGLRKLKLSNVIFDQTITSVSVALRIHVSPKTKDILEQLSRDGIYFKTQLRGEVEMKGKGNLL